MLCDSVINHIGSSIDTAEMGHQVTALGDAILGSECFYLSPDTMAACQQLVDSRPSSLLAAASFCRVPFQRVWLERDGHIPGRNVDVGDEDRVTRRVPKRMGALIECFDESYQHFGVSFCWSFPDSDIPDALNRNWGNLNICPLGIVVNWANKNWSREIDLKKATDSKNRYAKYLNNSEELESFKKLESMYIVANPPHTHAFINHIKKKLSTDQLDMFLSACVGDIQGEVMLILAALCLLNSKNCVEQSDENSPTPKQNKARVKNGKPPLISYKTVKIALSKSQRNAAIASGLSETEIRRHIVRGHFKIKKTGVYWWRPHIRGSSKHGEIRRSGYEVSMPGETHIE